MGLGILGGVFDPPHGGHVALGRAAIAELGLDRLLVLVVADVPGLIEGAAEGAGLGHEFLAHLERARLLVHVIDIAAGEIEEQYSAIRHELSEYGAGLDELPEVVVLNKMDLVPKRTGLVFDAAPVLRTFELSCATGEGIEAFERAIFELCPPEEPRPASEHALPEFLEYHPQARRRPTFRILRTDRGYRVVGTPPPPEELADALRKAGVRRGAEVEVGEEMLEWG